MSRTIVAQQDPSVFDNEVLDQFRIPFGDWIKQTVFWADLALENLFRWLRWPFQEGFNLLLEARFAGFPWQDEAESNRDPIFDFNFGLIEVNWWIVVVLMSVLALFMRNAKVATFVAIALTVCGLLGNDMWVETAKTIGMVVVAVVLCAIIGIPLGIACGRMDSVWSVVRPTLDAMQVVHSFVYMLPFIFFFGIGEVSATMVTMVFALPPLVRLTNLGIRQVPEDVVEASRAFGAPESRVLFDVQLPLARTAIMTGLNQTLLLAFSMLGIAAIMGAGGLGKLMFRAINNQDAALAASSGLAFFLVAVVMDRMSQREGVASASFGSRLMEAVRNVRTPEKLLEGVEEDLPTSAPKVEEMQPLTGAETMGMPIVAIASVVALVSLFLPWSSGGALVSSYSRRADADLDGSFNGLAATGGSWFGYLVAFFGLLALASAVNTLISKGSGPRFFSPEITVLSGGAIGGAALAFLMMSPSPLTEGISKGFGVPLALIAGVVIFLAGAYATFSSPYAPHTPLPTGVQWGQVAGGVFAVLLVVVGSMSYWSVDERGGTVITPEIEAEIEALREAAGDDLVKQAANAQLISNLVNSARASDRVNLNGFQSDGAGLAPVAIGLSLVSLVAAAVAAGLLGNKNERIPWAIPAVVGILAIAILIISFSWIGLVALAGAALLAGVAYLGQTNAQLGSAANPIVAAVGVAVMAVAIAWIASLAGEAGPEFDDVLTSLAVLAIGLALFATGAATFAGRLGLDTEQRRWALNAIVAGLGMAVTAVAFGWIGSLARATDPKFVSGVGSFAVLCGGLIIFATARPVLSLFFRRKVYAATSTNLQDDKLDGESEIERELITV